MKPGYKQTEVGVIPNDWNLVRLGDLGSVRGRVGWKGYTKKDLVDSGAYAIGGKHIDAHNRLDLSDPTFLSEAKYLESPEIMVEKEDLLIAQRGTIGKLVYIDREIGRATINPSLVILRLRRANPGFIWSYFTSESGQHQIFEAVSSTSVPMISQAQIENFVTPLPAEPEQRAIASALSEVDALLAALDRLLAKKRDLKQAAMQQLLTGQTRLPGFEREWVVKRLGEICELGMGRTPSRLNPEYWGRGYKWLSIADLQTKVVSESKEEVTELAASAMTIIPKGTLLMSFKLSLGRLCFAGCDLFTNEAICSFRKLQANSDFLYYVLGRTDFSLYGKQAVKGYTLNTQSLKAIEVPIPSLEEQAAIAVVLSDIDAELSALEQRREKTRALKQGMMQELLTGRTRLA